MFGCLGFWLSLAGKGRARVKVDSFLQYNRAMVIL